MFLFWAALAPAGISAQDLPEPMSPRRLVNDFAGLLSDSQRQALERKLVDFDRETSTQIAVVTVDDLGDYAPSDFAQRLHDKWGVGREGKNNGILVLVKPSVPGSRGEAYISVGYGLEGACAHHTQVVENMFQLVAEKATSLYERVEVLSRRSIRDKLMCYFSLMAAKNRSGEFSLPFSLSALADYISTDRSAMMRELKKMRQEELVDVHGRKVLLQQGV